MASKSISRFRLPRIERRSLAGSCAALLLSSLTLSLPYFAAAKDKAKKASADELSLKGLPPTDLSEDQAVAHALNRLGYGPRPGDIERVKQMGLAKWIDRQLHPESIDDSALNARLQSFPTLIMSSEKLMDEFPQPKKAAKREGVNVQEYRKEQQEKQQQQNAQDQQAMDLVTAVAQTQGSDGDAAAQAKMDSQGDQGGDADMSAPGGKSAKGAKGSGILPNRMMNFQDNHTPQRVVAELSMAKLDRAIYSERQLEVQMADFWFNHFNVFAGKGLDRWMLTSYERDAIQPHAMGKFRDLLEATAKSPAMLFYLDNWQSVDPEAWARLQREQAQRRMYRGRFGGPFGFPPVPPPGANQAKNKKQERGLNENYGRELMELHTLGVDGGYTQDDVIAVARCFTGWSIRTPQRDPQFYFEERLHDNKPKMVLGHKIDAGGMRDGEEVLDLLARDPHTAHHLSLEIAQHFVSDNPPEALVTRMEQTYLATDGDIRAVLHTMIYSPEFWSQETYRAKIKTPVELVASAARAVNADVQVPFLLVQWTSRIGGPLYQCQPPTGYSDKADAWVNTGALLNRLNYSLALANGRLAGVRVNIATVLGTDDSAKPDETLDRAIAVLLSGEASSQTRETLAKQMHDPQVVQASLDDPITRVNDGVIAGLVLGAPEFQRR
jgi:uncharacterized protein (DUF1800 family)